MKMRDNISRNAIIVGYVQEEEETDAFKMFNRMRLHGIIPDEVALSSILSSYGNVKLLEAGLQFHCLIVKLGLETNLFVGSYHIDMYSKCWSIEDGRKIYSSMPEWSVVILGLQIHCAIVKRGPLCGKITLKVFNEMVHSCVTPDDVTFLGVFTACSHAGCVSEGRQIFSLMVNCYGIKPRDDHYACIVDLLGRWGNLKEAEEFIDKLNVEPNAMIWANLLGACRIHGDDIRGEQAATNIIKLEPDNSTPYVLLSNMYAASGH
ncbi:Pentatricopeptide repeat-containing protein [Arachis hypogaea]|nr:Pentatricopeptide repeat-containing protein [Arachis hypogaea]